MRLDLNTIEVQYWNDSCGSVTKPMRVEAPKATEALIAARHCRVMRKYGTKNIGVSLTAPTIPMSVPRQRSGNTMMSASARSMTGRLICPRLMSYMTGADTRTSAQAATGRTSPPVRPASRTISSTRTTVIAIWISIQPVSTEPRGIVCAGSMMSAAKGG